MAKFCVGLSGSTEALQLVLDKFGGKIHEVFVGAPPDVSGSGRAGTVRTDEAALREQAALAHEAGVEFVVAANATCYGGRQFSQEFRHRFLAFLDFLADAQVEAITIAEVYLIELALEYRRSHKGGPRVYVSSLAEVVEPAKARRFDEMGVDRIVLHQNVNRDFRTLKQIIETVRCDLELYANTGSLYQCPYRHSHRSFIAHASAAENECEGTGATSNWYKERCIAIRQANPIEIVMAPTIRPEDVSFYENLGIRYFKIAGRNMRLDWLAKVLTAYIGERSEGGIGDLCDTNLGRLMPYVANTLLDGFLDFLRESADKPGYDYVALCRTFYESRIAPVAAGVRGAVGKQCHLGGGLH